MRGVASGISKDDPEEREGPGPRTISEYLSGIQARSSQSAPALSDMLPIFRVWVQQAGGQNPAEEPPLTDGEGRRDGGRPAGIKGAGILPCWSSRSSLLLFCPVLKRPQSWLLCKRSLRQPLNTNSLWACMVPYP